MSENKYLLQVGKFSGYIPELMKFSEAEFIATYKDKVNVHVETIWHILQERIKELGLNENTEINNEAGKESKKSKRKKSDDFPVQQSGV